MSVLQMYVDGVEAPTKERLEGGVFSERGGGLLGRTGDV